MSDCTNSTIPRATRAPTWKANVSSSSVVAMSRWTSRVPPGAWAPTDVQIAMRENEDNIPASPEEAAGARAENIPLHTALNFLGIKDDGNGNVAGLECQRVSKFDIDADGRWIADVIAGSDFVIEADVVVFSAGQKAGLSLIPQASGVKVNANHTLEVNAATFTTGQPGIFAAGDAVSGTSFVIEAVSHRP